MRSRSVSFAAGRPHAAAVSVVVRWVVAKVAEWPGWFPLPSIQPVVVPWEIPRVVPLATIILRDVVSADPQSGHVPCRSPFAVASYMTGAY